MTIAVVDKFGASDPAPYSVDLAPSFAPMLDLWDRMAEHGGEASPFQRRAWLEAWSATLGRRDRIDLVGVTVRDACGTPVMGLPLQRSRTGLCHRIGFVDDGLADYNAPILGAGAPRDAAAARRAWQAVLRVLPRSDLVRLEKMPRTLGDRPNPLALLRGVQPARAVTLALAMPGAFADWRAALPRRYRMELGRCARLFEALPGARFERTRSGGLDVMAALERLQRQRIDALGLTYVLDGDAERAFYRALAADWARGGCVLTALVADGAIVAALFGLRYGSHCIMLRLGADEAHGRYSPARHLIVKTMEVLRAEGVEHFDFGLGDYAYKRRLGGEAVNLCELVTARSPFGLGAAASFRIKARIHADPRLHATLSGLRDLTKRRAMPRFGQNPSP